MLTARNRMTSHLLRLRVGALDGLRPGDLLSRVTSDTTLLRSVTTYGLVHSVNGIFLIAAAAVMMAVLDPVLLLVTVAVLALNGVAVAVVVPRIRTATKRSQAAVGRMGSVLERALGALRTVKASGAEERELAAVTKAARRAWRRGVEVAGWTATMEATAGLAVQVSFLAVLGVGGLRVATGALPVSSLIAFLLYLFLLTDPITSLVTGLGQLQAGLAAVVRLREVQELPDRACGRPRRRAGPPASGRTGQARRRSSSAGCGSATTGPRSATGSTGTCPSRSRGRRDRVRRPVRRRQEHHIRPARALLRAGDRHHRGRRPQRPGLAGLRAAGRDRLRRAGRARYRRLRSGEPLSRGARRPRRRISTRW